MRSETKSLKEVWAETRTAFNTSWAEARRDGQGGKLLAAFIGWLLALLGLFVMFGWGIVLFAAGASIIIVCLA